MAFLEVYNKFGEHLESHELHQPLTEWLAEHVGESYKDSVKPPYSATLNGLPWPHVEHDEHLTHNDKIILTIEPDAVEAWVFWVILALSAGYSYYVTSNLPTYENSSEPGKSIYSPNARANSAVPSGLIRQVAGKMQIFPDLICPQRRKYIDHEEFLYLMLSVGEENFFLQKSNIFIAETPIGNYESDIDTQIFEPGALVDTHEAHENWYQTKEVASLRLITKSTPQAGTWTADFGTDLITSSLNGTIETFPFVVDENFEITGGTNPGFYQVIALSGGSSETAQVIGLERAGGDTGRLEASMQLVSTRGEFINSPVVTTTRRIFTSTGTPSLAVVSGEATTWDGINGGVNWEGNFNVIPQGETTRFAEVDVIFPQGLTDIDSSNDNKNTTVDITIQWREIGDSLWNTVAATSFTEATYSVRAFTIEIDFGSQIVPEMRIRRVTKDSEFNQLSDIVEIQRIKCLLETPIIYPTVTTIAMRLRGTNALARTAENRINIRNATRKLPTIAELQTGVFNLNDAATNSTANEFDVVNALFDYSFTFQSEFQSFVIGLDIFSEGTKLLVGGGNKFATYDLLIPYDVRSASVIGHGELKNTPVVSAGDVRFGDSGTKIYFLRTTTKILYQWDLSVAYDASTATDASKNAVLGVETSDPEGITIKDDGAKFYVADGSGQIIYQYSLTTPWDMSTSSFDSKSFDVSTELGTEDADGVFITDEGVRMYVFSDAQTVYTYTLSTAWDVSTAVSDSQSFIATAFTNSQGIWVKSDMLFLGDVSGVNIFAYDLPTVSDNRATRSIARFVGKALFDALGPDSATSVDWAALDTLDTLWEGRGDFLDGEFVDETTLWEAIKIMLGPGYSEPTIKEGIFLPVRIATGTDHSHLYTPDVMINDGLRIDHVHFDGQEPDGVDVEYFDETTQQMEVIEARATGDAGLRPKRTQAIGMINSTRAWRFGMRERNRFRQKPATYTFTTEMDALNSNYGDPIAIASDVFVSQYGEVTAVSGSDVTLDFDPVFGVGTHFAAFRNREGEFSGLYTVVAGPSSNQITLSSPTVLDFTPVLDDSMDPTLMSFGIADEWGVRAIVRRITPISETEVEVTAEEYVAAIFGDDDNFPP